MRLGVRLVAVSSLLVAWVLLSPSPGRAQPKPQPAPPGDNCAACHLETGDERLEKPARAYKDDIHAAKGLGCVACHGGDARQTGMEAMDPKKGFIGKPKRPQVIEVCGHCHSDARFMKQYNPALRVDQVTEYWTSVHGRRLKEANDPKVAICTSCHPAHAIQPPSDPRSSVHPLHVADTCGRCHADANYMASYKIPTDQVAKYKHSVHANAMTAKGDLSAPTCNSCHGNHGAAPPGITWVGNVCGQCHAVQGELFSKSIHAKVFAQMGQPGCATCHENHQIKAPGDEMLGLGGKAVCSNCHSATDAGGKAAVAMRTSIDTLRVDYDRAHGILAQAEHAGMEVSQPLFDLNGASDALVKARAAVHAFNPTAVQKESDAGLQVSKKAYERGVRAMRELGFRRKGLAVSLIIVLAVIAGIVVKMRDMEHRRDLRHEGPGGV